MTVWSRLCGMGLVMLLAGCGGNDDGNEAANDAVEAAPVEQAVEPESAPEPQVAPFDEPVTIDFQARLLSDRRLVVEGQSNLPEGARLQVVVERELSGVRWQSRTTLQDGRFNGGPYGPGSGLPDGGYRITVNLPAASVQPLEVRRRIGEEGEHLRGPLVGTSRHGLGQVASTSRRFLVGSEPRRTKDEVDVLTVE